MSTETGNAGGVGDFNPSSSFNKYINQYAQAKYQYEQYWSEWLSMYKNQAKNGKFAPGMLLMLATSLLLPSKTVMNQMHMAQSAEQLNVISYLQSLMNKLQNAFENGDTSNPKEDYANFKKAVQAVEAALKNSNDPWISGGSKKVEVNGETITVDVPALFSTTQLDNLNSEVGVFSKLLMPNGDPYSLLGAQEAYHKGGDAAQTYTSAISEMSQQTSGISSYEQSLLQYNQQNYSKLLQIIQDIMSDLIKAISLTNQATGKG